jgi:hypothetical protein
MTINNKGKEGVGLLTVVAIMALVAVIGFGAYAVINDESVDELIVEREEGESDEGVTESESGNGLMVGEATLRQLVLLGDDLMCDVTIENTIENITVESRLFTANDGEQIRNDFTILAGQEPVRGIYIKNGSSAFVWTEDEERGFKFTLDEDEYFIDELEVSSDEVFTSSDRVQYECVDWEVDGETFVEDQSRAYIDVDALQNLQVDAMTEELNDSSVSAEAN